MLISGAYQRTAYDALRGLSTAVDAFADLGINIYAADGQLKGTEQLFMESAEALSKMENNTKKAALATVVFGRAGTSLLPMLRDGPEGLLAVMEEAKKLGIVMSTEDATAAAQFADAEQNHPADLAIDSPYLLDLLPDRWASMHPASVRNGRIEEREDALDVKRLRRVRARIAARAAQAATP